MSATSVTRGGYGSASRDLLLVERSPSADALDSALEAPFGGRRRRWEVERYRIGEQTVTLAYHPQPPLAAPVLLAISNDDAPRVLRLTSGGKPLALSRDGRTLFFRRENALWRLDLRKPLPELTSE